MLTFRYHSGDCSPLEPYYYYYYYYYYYNNLISNDLYWHIQAADKLLVLKPQKSKHLFFLCFVKKLLRNFEYSRSPKAKKLSVLRIAFEARPKFLIQNNVFTIFTSHLLRKKIRIILRFTEIIFLGEKHP